MRLQFPEGFLLGVSSASAQIEGGEVGSNWNDWYHQGRIKDDSDPAVADDHWNRWREDCALMAGLHLGFAFPFVYKLLMLFGLYNRLFLLEVTGAWYLVFAVFYVAVYAITSRAYYRIVSAGETR